MVKTPAMNNVTSNELVHRVRGEFMEMPGLRLSLPQAQRLWGLDSTRCEAVLNALVDSGILTCTPQHVFALRRSEP